MGVNIRPCPFYTNKLSLVKLSLHACCKKIKFLLTQRQLFSTSSFTPNHRHHYGGDVRVACGLPGQEASHGAVGWQGEGCGLRVLCHGYAERATPYYQDVAK